MPGGSGRNHRLLSTQLHFLFPREKCRERRRWLSLLVAGDPLRPFGASPLRETSRIGLVPVAAFGWSPTPRAEVRVTTRQILRPPRFSRTRGFLSEPAIFGFHGA